MSSSKELHAGERLRKGEYSGSSSSQNDIINMARTSTLYMEAVVAMLLDAVERYTEAAARDRESQEKERQAQASARDAREKEMRELAERDDKHMAVQRRQGWIMLVFTVMIAISTAIHTVAAWKQAQQPISSSIIAPSK
jgi:hypothetical protein